GLRDDAGTPTPRAAARSARAHGRAGRLRRRSAPPRGRGRGEHGRRAPGRRPRARPAARPARPPRRPPRPRRRHRAGPSARALALVGGLVATIAGHAGALPALAGLALGGVIGFVDDISKLRRGSIGIPARLKLPIQLVLAIPVAWIALDGQSLWWLPLAVVAVAAAGNAVNITDGIDGLAAGLSIIAVGATVLLLPGAPAGEKAVAMTVCGALAGFLC